MSRRTIAEIRDIASVILMFCVGFLIAISLANLFPFETMNDMSGSVDDNSIEEAVESLIDHVSGIDIDLTPRSKEMSDD